MVFGKKEYITKKSRLERRERVQVEWLDLELGANKAYMICFCHVLKINIVYDLLISCWDDQSTD